MWVDSDRFALNDLGRSPARLRQSAADRRVQRVPRHRCLHPGRRRGRLDPRRRHGRTTGLHRRAPKRRPTSSTSSRTTGSPHDRTLAHPGRLRQPRPSGRPGRATTSAPACWPSAPSWTSTSPSSARAPQRFQVAGSWPSEASRKLSWCRCCSPTRSTRMRRFPALVAQIAATSIGDLKVTALPADRSRGTAALRGRPSVARLATGLVGSVSWTAWSSRRSAAPTSAATPS